MASVNTLISLAKEKASMETDTNEDEDPFQQVKRRKRNPEVENMFHPKNRTREIGNPSIELQNRYTPLETIKDKQSNEQPGQVVMGKPKTPPPIVVHDKLKDPKKFMSFISEKAGKQFHIKYTSKRFSIHTHDNATYQKMLALMIDEQIASHTYTPQNEKTNGFVIRGLDLEPDTEEIKENLQEKYKITAKEVFKMHTKHRPLYLVITSKDVKLTFLKENVKYICHTKIIWEKHENNKITSQCRRCLEWGHAASNCYAEPACAHCAQAHWTHQCLTKEKQYASTASKQIIKHTLQNVRLTAKESNTLRRIQKNQN